MLRLVISLNTDPINALSDFIYRSGLLNSPLLWLASFFNAADLATGHCACKMMNRLHIIPDYLSVLASVCYLKLPISLCIDSSVADAVNVFIASLVYTEYSIDISPYGIQRCLTYKISQFRLDQVTFCYDLPSYNTNMIFILISQAHDLTTNNWPHAHLITLMTYEVR